MESQQPRAEKVLDELPDNFPAISVSLEFGKVLKKMNRVIDIDFTQLSQVMLDRGIPEDQFENVEFMIDATLKPLLRGEAYYDKANGICNATVFPTLAQQFGLRKNRLQMTTVHEMQHVSDYFEQDRLHESDEKTIERNRIKLLRENIATSAITGFAILTTPAVAQGTFEAMRNNPEFHNIYGLVATLSIPLYWAGFAYPLTKRQLYRSQIIEKNARKAEHMAKDYTDIISIYPAT